MVRAVLMTKEQIRHLAEIAMDDASFWQMFKDRELNQLDERGEAKFPSMAMLVGGLARANCGTDHIFEIGRLNVYLRCLARIELGLPVGEPPKRMQ